MFLLLSPRLWSPALPVQACPGPLATSMQRRPAWGTSSFLCGPCISVLLGSLSVHWRVCTCGLSLHYALESIH